MKRRLSGLYREESSLFGQKPVEFGSETIFENFFNVVFPSFEQVNLKLF